MASDTQRDLNPYQSPQAIIEAESRSGEAPIGYKDQTSLVKVVLFFLSGQGLFSLFLAVYMVGFGFDFWSDETYDRLAWFLDSSDTFAIGVFLATAIPFGMFLVQANRNARSFGYFLRYSPASMVWWHFVPIFSLFRPFQAIRAVWDASVPTRHFKIGGSNLLGTWWTLWVVRTLSNQILSKVPDTAESLWFWICASNVLEMALCVAAGLVVQQLHERQQTRAYETDEEGKEEHDVMAETLDENHPLAEGQGAI